MINKKNIIKAHKSESGQAFTELCISLIPLLCVMLFLIYFAGISISSINVLLEARGDADTNAVDGGTSTLGQVSIVRSWEYGHDQEDASMGAAYFQDDVSQGSSSVNDASFIGTINDGKFIPSVKVSGPYVNRGYGFGSLADGDLFLDAARLASNRPESSDIDSVATLVKMPDNEREQMDKTFDSLLPGDGLMARLNANEQRDWKSNQVYMPEVIPPPTASTP